MSSWVRRNQWENGNESLCPISHETRVTGMMQTDGVYLVGGATTGSRMHHLNRNGVVRCPQTAKGAVIHLHEEERKLRMGLCDTNHLRDTTN